MSMIAKIFIFTGKNATLYLPVKYKETDDCSSQKFKITTKMTAESKSTKRE